MEEDKLDFQIIDDYSADPLNLKENEIAYDTGKITIIFHDKNSVVNKKGKTSFLSKVKSLIK